MAKQVESVIKLHAPAGAANPAPPIGTALGPAGINIMEFCKSFNSQTGTLEPGTPIPTVITVYADRTFSFETKSPPASFLIKKAAKVEKGSGTPNTEKVGRVTRTQLEDIAKIKDAELTSADLDAAVKTLAGTARSVGIEVEGL